jgi:hypothetical protein
MLDKLQQCTDAILEAVDSRPRETIVMADPELEEFSADFPVDQMLVERHMELYPADARARKVVVICVSRGAD